MPKTHVAAPTTDVRGHISDALLAELKTLRRNPRIQDIHVMSQAPGSVKLNVQVANPEMLGIKSGDVTSH